MAQQKSNKPMLDRPRAPKKPLVLPTPEEDRRKQQQQQQQQPLLTPESNGDDPFAGMNSSINYQQEIERLKALVPKVDGGAGTSANGAGTTMMSAASAAAIGGGGGARKRMSPRPKSYDPKTSTCSSRRSPPSTRPMSAAPAPRSGGAGPATTTSTAASSPVPTPRSITPPKDDAITEEEKLRFLRFMRNWTGSWKAWDGGSTGHYGAGIESLNDGYSLWARQMPWTTGHT